MAAKRKFLPDEVGCNELSTVWVGKFSTWQFCDCDLFWYGENVTSNGIKRSRIESPGSKWWFERLFLFTLIPGGMIQFDDCAYFSGFGGGFNHQPKFWSSVFRGGDENPPPAVLPLKEIEKQGERHGEGWQGMWAEGKSCAAFLLIHVFLLLKFEGFEDHLREM